MENSKKKMLVKAGAIALAFVLITSAFVISKNTALKATDEMMEAAGVDAPVEEIVEPIYEPAFEPIEEEPFIEYEEIPVDEIEESEILDIPEEEIIEDIEETEPAAEDEDKPEETVEEEEKEYEEFDVEKAYEHYMSLGTEEEKSAFLQSLSEEDRAELVRYIEAKALENGQLEEMPEDKEDLEEMPEDKEEEKPAVDISKLKVNIWDDRSSSMTSGQTVTLYSSLEGFEGLDVTYQWRVNKGAGYEDVPGANGPTYSFTASQESLSWRWKLHVEF